jgi:hypothetical protein
MAPQDSHSLGGPVTEKRQIHDIVGPGKPVLQHSSPKYYLSYTSPPGNQ